MILDADVVRIAKHFGADPTLVQAVVNAEGNIIAAVNAERHLADTREQALEITARSANHAMRDFVVQHGYREAFIAFWAARWAPLNATNDTQHLNVNWPRNVLSYWRT